jgi:hypothetical protein
MHQIRPAIAAGTPPAYATNRTFAMLSRSHLLTATSLILAGALTACGDGGDHAHNFTGTWTGTSALSGSGTGRDASTPFNITSPEANTLELGNFCADGSGPKATAVSADTFEIQPFECSPERTDTCDAVVFKVTGGTGTLTNDKLSIVLQGTATGCNEQLSFEVSFTGESMFERRL